MQICVKLQTNCQVRIGSFSMSWSALDSRVTCRLIHLSRLVGNRTMWFPTRSDTNRPVQAQKRDRNLKFRIYVEEELYYPSSENKGADQLRSYCEADLRLCFRLARLLVLPCRGLFASACVTRFYHQDNMSVRFISPYTPP